MKHFAELVSVLTYPNVPENIMPFVVYKARIDNVTLEKGLKIIVLRVTGTNSYHVIFPERTTIERCLAELEEAGISINRRTKLYMDKYIR
ncbi:MAG: DUF749 family protein [Thermoplasmata archaeon]